MTTANAETKATARKLTSAQGLIALLQERPEALRVHGLRLLNDAVQQKWAEVASCVCVIESMYEDEFFSRRDLAALVASKVRIFVLSIALVSLFCLLAREIERAFVPFSKA